MTKTLKYLESMLYFHENSAGFARFEAGRPMNVDSDLQLLNEAQRHDAEAERLREQISALVAES